MKRRPRTVLLTGVAILGVAALCWSFPIGTAEARSQSRPDRPEPGQPEPGRSGPADATSRSSGIRLPRAEGIARHGLELLDVAFGAACAFPVDPHHKDRSRAQEQVVTACLELGQPAKALACLEQIDDWRRGGCYADLARYCMRHGEPASAERLLEAACRDFERAGLAADQEWRRDRVRSKIARVYLGLGQAQRAASFGAGLVDSEAGRVAEAEAELLVASGFDERMATLEAVIQKGGFEPVRNALAACSKLHDRFYADRQRRQRLETDIRNARKHLPVLAFLEVMSGLVRNASSHDDRSHALELIEEGERIIAAARWLPQDQVAAQARFAKLAGEARANEASLRSANAARALYEGAKDRIVDIERAGALRPLAEAYVAIDARDTALAVFRDAVEAGASNPNARPRADDLVATCCAMARCGLEPDAALWARIRQVRAGLAPPW